MSCKQLRKEETKTKERYTHLNAEFQRIARRDKKAFLGDQCEEIEANNRMGKTRDIFKVEYILGHKKVLLKFLKTE